MSSEQLMEWFQGPGGSVLALVIIAGIMVVLVLGVFLLIRIVWRWIGRRDKSRPQASNKAPAPVHTPPSGPFIVTAADIMAIKSNLDAVSRQLADLELKLRLNPPKRDTNSDRP